MKMGSKLAEDVVSEIRKDYIMNLLSSGRRADGRDFEEYRKIDVVVNFAKRAEGSALVRLGETQVLVGVKMDIGEPFADTPNQGVMTTNVELVPIASPTFEPGPPNEEAIEIARVVDRGIRESKAIDLEKLCIEEGEKVWIVFIDIHVLNYDGNLIDASALGAMIALKNTIVPGSKFGYEDFPLPVNHYPVAVTVAKVGKTLLVDPCLEEENLAEARLTVTTDENGDIRAMQKGLSGSLTYDEVKKVINMSQRIGKEIREKYILSGD